MTDINLRILLNAVQGNTLSVINSVTKALGTGSSSGGGIGLQGALTAVGVAAAGMAVAIGVEAVNKSSAFQNAMLQNVAHAGLAKNQFDAVSQSVLQMSTDVGQMPTDLAQGLYPILSGFSGITDQSAKAKSSLEALRLAAEDVVGTETKTTVTSGALVSAFNALGLQTNDTATNISRLQTLNDQMEATVIAGNMHWDQYANVVGKLATAIKGTHVSFTEASAALATMTNEGFSAQRSQTYLANLFTQMDLKTDSLAKNAKKLNIHFDEQKFRAMSLTDQLTYLKEITGGNSSEVLKLLNNNATALKTYNALSTNLKTYQTNLDAVKHSHGATATAFQTASSGFDASKNRMKAAIDVLLIDLGTMLLPVLSNLMDWLTPIIKNFANWVTNSKDLHTWINNVGSFIQYTLVPWITNLWNGISQVVQWGQKAQWPFQVLGGLLQTVVGLVAVQKFAKMATDISSTALNMASLVTQGGAKLLAFLGADQLAGKLQGISNLLGGKGGVADEAKAAGLALGEEGLAGDATAAEKAIGSAGAASGVGLAGAVAGLISTIASIVGVALVEFEIAKFLKDNHILPDAPKKGLPDWVTHQNASSHQAQGGTNLKDAIPSPTSISIRRHAAGGVIAEPVVGFGMRSGQGYSFAENGPETVLPGVGGGRGGHTFIINVSTLAGSRSEVMRMVDLLEAEIASRFRSQTPSFGFGGVL